MLALKIDLSPRLGGVVRKLLCPRTQNTPILSCETLSSDFGKVLGGLKEIWVFFVKKYPDRERLKGPSLNSAVCQRES